MKQNKLSVAVTGGIASGKSAISAVLQELGATVAISDNINRDLWNDKGYVAELRKAFPSIFDGDAPNKKKLRHLIFNNKAEREKLNQLAHPRIVAEILRQKQQSSGIFVAEIPLLYEMREEVDFDRVLVVISDRDKRIQRLSIRDNVEADFAEVMIDTQPSDQKLLSIATDVIKNDGNIDNLRSEVAALYTKWQNMLEVE